MSLITGVCGVINYWYGKRCDISVSTDIAKLVMSLMSIITGIYDTINYWYAKICDMSLTTGTASHVLSLMSLLTDTVRDVM